jgi:hypothetical protein
MGPGRGLTLVAVLPAGEFIVPNYLSGTKQLDKNFTQPFDGQLAGNVSNS